MSDIDRDALAFAAAEAMDEPFWLAAIGVDAILPTVTQAIRAAEQRCIHGERCITCRAIVKRRNSPDYPDPDPLARGGSTDEEQT